MSAPTASDGTMVLDIGGLQLATSSPGFAEAIARAYQQRVRPRCLCRREGIAMYLSRHGDGYIVKRMPGTGHDHAPDCPSFEPAADLTGLGPLLGTAIREDPATGITTLRLDFSLSSRPGAATPAQPARDAGPSARSSQRRLSLRNLLHYLWDQAGLTRWHPGFEGRRYWGTVRRQLLLAAQPMCACGESLATWLYVPEPFSVEHHDSIMARRAQAWAGAAGTTTGLRRHLLLIAEVKELSPARHGHRAIIKHLPDLAFALEASLYRQLVHRFKEELALWSTADCTHMIMIATFGLDAGGVPHVSELSLMTVNACWLPVETVAELQLVDSMVHQRRSFLRLLCYGRRPEAPIPCLAFTDRGDPAPLVYAPGFDEQNQAGCPGQTDRSDQPESQGPLPLA